MKAKIITITNYKDIERAEKLSLPIPDEENESRPMLFNFQDIELAYVTPENYIHIFLNGLHYEIEYDKNLWDRLETKFNS